MAMHVEIATGSEIPQLSRLLTLLFDQECDFASDTAKQSNGLQMIISNPATGTVFALWNDESVVGMVSLIYTISTALGGKVALLEDMIVLPDFRGNGAGTMLLQTAIRFAESVGCLRITLLTDRDNYLAQHFYRQHGFHESAMMTMRQSLTSHWRPDAETAGN